MKGQNLHRSAKSRYRPPVWLRNGHVQSIWPTLFRKVQMPEPQTEVISTPDDDQLHLDWYRQHSNRLAIISHGLEGHSRRPYVLGLARALMAAGWDVLAWNFRSCGGVMNRQPRFYHSGATEDLEIVINHALGKNYQNLFLSGFSMGGNLTLLYLGQQGEQVDSRISGAVVYSVPADLAGSADMLALPSRKIYMQRFLNDLHGKMQEKSELFPDLIDVSGFRDIRNFHEFDNRYTAPLAWFQRCAGLLGELLGPVPAERYPCTFADDQRRRRPFPVSGLFPGFKESAGFLCEAGSAQVGRARGLCGACEGRLLLVRATSVNVCWKLIGNQGFQPRPDIVQQQRLGLLGRVNAIALH